MPDGAGAGIQQELMNRLQSQDPRLRAAWQTVAREQPDAAGAATIRPMNWLERVFFPNDYQAVTHPWNTVAYRPELVKPEDAENLLTHELAHVRQNEVRGGTLRNLWQILAGDKTEDENEAYGLEQRQAELRNRKDIELPPMKRRER